MFWSAFAPPNTEKAVEKSIQAFFKETLTALLDVLDVTKELRTFHSTRTAALTVPASTATSIANAHILLY